jgi:hypothetical protein
MNGESGRSIIANELYGSMTDNWLPALLRPSFYMKISLSFIAFNIG